LIIEILEGEPDLVGTRGLEVADGQSVERRALPIGQRLRVAQPDIACATQQTLALLFAAAHLIDGGVDDLDGMELVESDGGVGQVLGDAFDEGWAHVEGCQHHRRIRR
jgi:hypothetical protein